MKDRKRLRKSSLSSIPVRWVLPVLWVLCAFSAGPPSLSAEMAWLLEQTNPHSPYSRSQTVILSSKGIKLLGPEVRVIIPSPAFKVSIFNDSTHEYFDAACDVWMKKYGARPLKKGGKYVRKSGKGEVAGLDAEKYCVCLKENGKERVLREFWTTSAMHYPQKMNDILLALCGLPAGYGVPLRLVRYFPDHTREALVDTLVAKRIPLKKDLYTLPTGYRRVESELTLLIDFGKND